MHNACLVGQIVFRMMVLTAHFPRVMIPVFLFQIHNGQVTIDIGAPQGCMPQQVLDVNDIGMVFNHFGGTTTPERVRRNMLVNTTLFGVAFDHVSQAGFTQPITLLTQEQCILPVGGKE